MVVALLYEIQMLCNWFTLSVSGSDSCIRNGWRDDHDSMMEIKVSSRWRWRSWRCFGYGDQRHKMMMAISCHIFWLHVMFIFYASYFAYYGSRIIRWSITKFQDISILPVYALLLQFIVLRHHVMIGCDKLYVHIQRVQASFARVEYSG